MFRCFCVLCSTTNAYCATNISFSSLSLFFNRIPLFTFNSFKPTKCFHNWCAFCSVLVGKLGKLLSFSHRISHLTSCVHTPALVRSSLSSLALKINTIKINFMPFDYFDIALLSSHSSFAVRTHPFHNCCPKQTDFQLTNIMLIPFRIWYFARNKQIKTREREKKTNQTYTNFNNNNKLRAAVAVGISNEKSAGILLKQLQSISMRCFFHLKVQIYRNTWQYLPSTNFFFSRPPLIYNLFAYLLNHSLRPLKIYGQKCVAIRCNFSNDSLLVCLLHYHTKWIV